MKIKVVHLIFTFLSVGLLFYGCTEKKKSGENKVRIIFPDSTEQDDEKLPFYFRDLSRAMNLKNLALGVDSIEIRLEQSSARFKPSFITIIKNENNLWSATLITRWSHFNELEYGKYDTLRNYLIVDSTRTENLIPKCSWVQLFDSLKLYHIFELPSQKDIDGFNISREDGWGYNFEIATKNIYKVYSYANPEYYSDPNNKAVTNLLGIFNRQLEIPNTLQNVNLSK